MTMKIAQIMVPFKVGADVFNWVGEELIAKWGGFTVYKAGGGWKSPSGEIIVEPVAAFHVAMEATIENHRALYDLAQEVAKRGAQEQVFIMAADGAVEFVLPA